MLFPVIVPLCIVGASSYLARSRQVSRSASGVSRSVDEPSPLTVMGSFLCLGQAPPPGVVFGAIGHAESLGYQELADELVRVFVLPGVDSMRAAPVADVNARRGTSGSYGVGPGTARMTSSVAQVATRESWPGPPEPPGAYSTVMGGDGVDVDAERVLDELACTEPATRVELLSDARAALVPDAEAQHVLDELAAAGERAAKVEIVASESDERVSEVVESSSTARSPIDGVAMPEWRAFVGRVSREPATFAARNHVGQFRQRRERLIEMGFDPAAIIGSPEAQRAALDAEMRDAYRHARASGLIDEYLGTSVAVSVGEDVRPTEVTLSGVLGVMQAAGLEGAVQWLEQPEDRTRFPHTTQAFLRCNGVF